MSDYDFKPLNDKEFEILCADLISIVESQRFERFKPGKDSGVDGRYFSNGKKEVILQCKHWANTPIAQLIRKISNEKPKLDKLKPNRYLIATSLPLSRSDKKAISKALEPYIYSESDIYGSEDLNDLIKKNPEVEKRHYKLWLHSSNVLNILFNNAIIGRSAFSLQDIANSSRKYVVTSNHSSALALLERLGVVIITGEPGVGKTTLADHLCLHYVTRDYQYLKISEDIREAESAFHPDSKQIFYFDDFLGRNYLEALKGHEGNQITQFIRRISAHKNKRFVLTSRSTILNQGKFLIDNFEHGNLRKNEYELHIRSLTEKDKAHILYNHIWHSSLSEEYIEQLYVDKRYRQIIGHRNFNPRLISYVTDSTRLDNCSSQEYWSYITKSLTNPAQVWQNPFEAQQDDYGRAIILLAVFNGGALNENTLAEAYSKYVALPENSNLKGRKDFYSNLRMLTGSFLNRTINTNGPPQIDLFNPSIGDYVLRRYAGDVKTIKSIMFSLRTIRSTITLRGLQGDRHLTGKNVQAICEELLEDFRHLNFQGLQTDYLATLFDVYKTSLDGENPNIPIDALVSYVYNSRSNGAIDYTFQLIHYGLKEKLLTSNEALDFIENNIQSTYGSATDIKSISALLNDIPTSTERYDDIYEHVQEFVFTLVSENLEDFIDVSSAFSNADYEDDYTASEEIKKLIEQELDDFGLQYSSNDVTEIIDTYDVGHNLRHYYENMYEGPDRQTEIPQSMAVDEIDDLFDRG